MNKITEGSASVSVPRQDLTRKAEAFYNPAMEYQRDITLSALRVYKKDCENRLSVCDPLAGTGVRSIRMAKEVPGISRIIANDLNPRAVTVMKKNVRSSGLGKKITVSNVSANKLFLEHPGAFDFVDIDPFGSHINYVFNAGFALKRKSMIACTATDTGALCGAFPSTCFTRYGIKNSKTDFYKEVGARVLITSTMLELSKHDISVEPLYSHANHYFRFIGRLKKSKSGITSQFRDIRFLVYCPSCIYRSFDISEKCPVCGKRTQVIGPLWSGKIHDRKFCTGMLGDMKAAGYSRTKELETALSEEEVPFYYDIHRMLKVRRSAPRKLSDIMEALENKGFSASRTRFCGTGVKTDAPYEEIAGLV